MYGTRGVNEAAQLCSTFPLISSLFQVIDWFCMVDEIPLLTVDLSGLLSDKLVGFS